MLKKAHSDMIRMMELFTANRAGLKGGDELIVSHGALLGTTWSLADMHVKTAAPYTKRDPISNCL